MTARQPAGIPTGGQFASTGQARAAVHLSAPPRRRGPVDMSAYFASAVPDVWNTPWIADGIHIGLDEATWRAMPVEDVDPRGMHATQRRVFHKHLDRHRSGGASPADADGGDLPWVVIYRDQRYVLDGHHRTVTAIDADAATMPAHVMRITAR